MNEMGPLVVTFITVCSTIGVFYLCELTIKSYMKLVTMIRSAIGWRDYARTAFQFVKTALLAIFTIVGGVDWFMYYILGYQ